MSAGGIAARREVHLQVKGVDELRLPGRQPGEQHDVFCVASLGRQVQRTRLLEATSAPRWEEEFVFDGSGSDTVIKLEVYEQSMFSSELLLYANLELDLCEGFCQQQQHQQVAAGAGGSLRGGSTSSSRSSLLANGDANAPSAAALGGSSVAGEGSDCDEELDDAAIAAAAAASRRCFGGSITSGRVPGASSARAKVEEAAVSEASQAFRAACGQQGTGTGLPGFSTEAEVHRLALFPAALASTGGTGLLGTGSNSGKGAASFGSKSMSKSRLQRSTHVRSGGELTVAVWFVAQPSLANLGSPPVVLSFVHPPGQPHPLPSASHSQLGSLWEEPPLAFIRLVVNLVVLGPAAAAAAEAAAAAGGAGSDGDGNPAAAAAALRKHKSAKVLLRQLRGLLRGDAELAEQQQQGQPEQQPGASRPSLAAIHGAGSLSLWREGSGITAAGAAAGSSSSDGAVWGWEALGRVSEDEETTDGGSDDEAADGHRWGLRARWARRGADSDDNNDITPHHHHPGQPGSSSTTGSRDTLPSSSSNKKAKKKQQRKGGSLADKLHLTVKVQLGSQAPQSLKPVPVAPDGCAVVAQAAVFAVTRPLQEAVISYELGFGVGPRGPPLLAVGFQYSLLHLLKRSPPQPVAWEEWRQVARCTCKGLQVPLPCLPGASLDLSAFVADADCRAGMYQVPTVAAEAVAAAEAEAAACATLSIALAAQASAEAERTAAAAAAAAQLAEDLTDSDNEESKQGLEAQHAAPLLQQQSSGEDIGRKEKPGPRGVLRMRPSAAAAAAAHGSQQQRREEPGRSAAMDQLKSRATAGMDRMMAGVQEGLVLAAGHLPDTVAEKVKGKLIHRFFPRSRRSEAFSIGQLRVLSRMPSSRQQQQQPQQQQHTHHQRHSSTGGSLPSSNSSLAASPTAAAAAASRSNAPLAPQQHASLGASLSGSLCGTSPMGSITASSPTVAAAAAAAAAAAVASAAAAAAAAAALVPLDQHPNMATAGSPLARPLGVLQLTIQGISLRSRSGSSSASSSSSQGVSLLMRCGPHWLQLAPAALPLTTYGGSSSTGQQQLVPGSSSKVPPVQVLLPVYGSNVLVALVLHRRSTVVGRCVFKLYGLMPLLIRDHVKTLILYSDKRGSGGQRIIAGTLLLRLAAGPPPGYSRLAAGVRMCYSYIVTPHTLELHTSGVLSCASRDDMDEAHARLVQRWLGEQDQHALPAGLVEQLLSSGRGAVSTRRMRGHVSRIKAVMLDWLPRRLDPLGFYHWHRPLHNVLALWVLSHACLYPHKWLFIISLLLTAVLIRRIAEQIRHGVLGFELDQLPPDLAAAAGGGSPLPQQQSGGSEAAGDLCETESVEELAHSLRSGGLLGAPAGAGHGAGGGMAALGERLRHKDAAERLRQSLMQGKDKVLAAAATHNIHVSATSNRARAATAAESFPTTLEELREQLEAGTLNLDTLDIEAVAQKLLSVGGLLKLARQHTSSMMEYALLLQNMLDDAASFAEGLYAMLTAQDPLAALVFCCILLSSASFVYFFGLGAGVYVVICILLRPPMLRGVPAIFGWKALLANLPCRSVEEMV